MKTSAKITTVTFLAAMALGAAALTGGCTVTSTSSTDTDGGTSSSGGSSSGGSSSGGSSGSTTTDGGGDSSTATCDNPKQTYKFPDTCQACLDTKCCDKLQACFNQNPAADGGADVDCNTYSECVSDCNADPNADQTCYDACDAATNQAIITAYDILTTCGETNCATECGGN